MTNRGYALALLAVLIMLWVPLAIDPFDRKDWLLENVLLVLAVALLVTSHRTFPLSRISYTLIFVFMCLHTIGAHYTYAEVPYDEAWRALAYPVREVFLRIAGVRGFWGYFLPLDLTMSTSMLYELIEWAAAEWFGGDLGVAYLGTQGDIWDAHKDMALASLGALLCMCIVALVNSRTRRDFAREWNDSLRVKHTQPLGEYELQ